MFNIFRATNRTSLILTLPILCGCVMTCSDYRYMSFSRDSGAEILETGVPNLRGFREVHPFPVSYSIARRQYKLKLDIIGYGPGVRISLAESDERLLSLQGLPATFRDGRACYSWSKREGSLVFGWIGDKACEGQQELHFEIVDATGTRVAEERISFDLATNGRYCVMDAP